MYLQRSEGMEGWLDDRFQMPDKMVALLIRFLEQNKGTLSKRSQEKEFAGLTEEDVREIEESYNYYFGIQKQVTADADQLQAIPSRFLTEKHPLPVVGQIYLRRIPAGVLRQQHWLIFTYRLRYSP